MSTIKSSSEDLTLNADGSGNDVVIQSNGATTATVTATGVDVTGGVATTTSIDVSGTDSKLNLTATNTGADHSINAASSVGALAIDVDANSEGSDARLVVNMRGSEAMRIDSGGNIFVGKTVNSYPVTGIKLGNNGRMQISTAVSDDNLALDKDVAGNFVYFSVNTGNVGTIYTNGSSTSYNTASDYRLKENVNYSFDATTRLKQLKPCRFNFITDVNTTVDGFLAHEVSQVVPEAVTGTKDATKQQDIINEDGEVIGTETVPDYQGIDQAKLVPLLVATIQELEARITALEAGA